MQMARAGFRAVTRFLLTVSSGGVRGLLFSPVPWAAGVTAVSREPGQAQGGRNEDPGSRKWKSRQVGAAEGGSPLDARRLARKPLQTAVHRALGGPSGRTPAASGSISKHCGRSV